MTLKKIFNHSISIFIHGYLFVHIYRIQNQPLSITESAMIAFGLTWLQLLFVLVLFKIQCNLRPPIWVLRFREFENKSFYDRMGVKTYRWLLLHSPFRYANGDIYLKSARGRSALKSILPKMEEAEFAHMIGFVLLTLASLIYSQLTFWLILYNLIFNLYPIMLQRYHRMRILRLLDSAAG